MTRGTSRPGQSYDWIVYGVALLLVGGLVGYLLTISSLRPAGTPAAAPAAAPAPTAGVPAPSGGAAMVDENALKAYRDILARDPKNVQAAVSAANMLYDAQRYSEAIPLYQQAFALNPTDINVSTDLGTALWYSGRPDEALAQFDKSLTINPTHPQTLFNKGVVLADGKHDYQAAIAAWDKLLRTTPGYPNATAVRAMIEDARQKAGASTHSGS